MEYPLAFDGTEYTQAQTLWHKEFKEKVADVQTAYHYWQNAEDRRCLNKYAEERNKLDHDATVKQNKHSDAMRWLAEWVQAHPYPAADQTAPTVTDSMREVNRLANLAEDKQQYRNGWNDAMTGVKDIQWQGKNPQDWAHRMLHIIADNEAGTYNRGSAGALNHFLQTGQTDQNAP